jgi:hypothetical protein
VLLAAGHDRVEIKPALRLKDRRGLNQQTNARFKIKHVIQAESASVRELEIVSIMLESFPVLNSRLMACFLKR